ncbi:MULTISPECIES: hypothetical protein [Sorangium]|uniref:Uncharacterized protein n=1 Tax=Sorangium cellulosum TaxID=56 RepID=A0A4P2R4D2_SORCE|nr:MULTISPECIES: hypothetical protein [Sorangium]AUX37929.1 hypothetical protein SOCE836_101670 [Sorangium cellulosum]WCQ97216.1 hypothetical protein NQZ70_10007 [Sorangium sp. Soce836]
MLSIRHDPFPLEAARDLLGIVRALYAAARARGASVADLHAIAAVGDDLRQAIALAAAHPPGTLGFSSAWTRAERAAARVGELADALAPAAPIVHAALARVGGGKATPGG